MDDLAQHNRARWNELAASGVRYSRPWLDMDRNSARARVDPLGFIGDIAHKRVLCLAAGGGQQSAAFALLGAQVTVLDLSDEMLAHDQLAARHFNVNIETLHGDARDLSCFSSASFDLVWQAHSLPFIPELERVFDGVARILRPGAIYHLSTWNPLAHGAHERWTGTGYLLREDYVEGTEAVGVDALWKITGDDGQIRHVPGPREFRHTLTGLMNGLISRGFVFLDVHEEPLNPQGAEPGSWSHFCSVVPPWLYFWTRLCPDTLIRNK